MFESRKNASILSAIFRFLEVVYFGVVQNIRKSDGNALVGLIKSMLQAMTMVVIFYVMLTLLGAKAMAVRGDYFLFLLSGILLFLTHVKTFGAVMSAEGPTSPMMMHTPMNTLIAIFCAALSALYTQVLTLFTLLLIYHVAWMPLEVEYPAAAFGMFMLSWYSGVGVGYVLLALQPWIPGIVATIKTVYMRVNMFASGKMMVANSLPFTMIPMFSWNPLFHFIDQARGFTFVNYVPHITNYWYGFWVATAMIMIGFIGEGFNRQLRSVSWAGKT